MILARISIKALACDTCNDDVATHLGAIMGDGVWEMRRELQRIAQKVL